MGIDRKKFMPRMINVLFLVAGFSVLPTQVTYGQTAAPENLNKLINQCGACHGMEGNSAINTIPSIAGISEAYFKYAMREYQNGNRKSDMMHSFADTLTEADIDHLANYFSKQIFKSRDQIVDEDLAQKGKAIHETYCIKCHDNLGSPDQYRYGILAGQWMPYLRQAIKDYLDGTRKTNPMMLIKLNRVKNEIGDQGFEELVQYYAGTKYQYSPSQSH
jgi:sulfide dehydrogenase cytochrome subunit